jgi:hypothetical protein
MSIDFVVLALAHCKKTMAFNTLFGAFIGPFQARTYNDPQALMAAIHQKLPFNVNFHK